MRIEPQPLGAVFSVPKYPPRRKVRTIVLHHTVSAETTTAADVDHWHRQRGFRKIGYHILVRRKEDGTWEAVHGRDLLESGAGAPGHNADGIHIAVAGRYHLTTLSEGALEQLVGLCTSLCRWAKLPASAILGHREVIEAATACPGFDPAMVRERASAELVTAP